MTINGSTNNANWTFKLEAYETSYSIENNTSVVRIDMYLGRASSRSYLGGNWSASITVDGSSQSLSGNISYPTYINGGDWLYLGSKDYTVGHNTAGDKITEVSSSFSSNDFTPSSASASGNLPLTTIPRASNVTVTNADIGSATSININRTNLNFKHTLTYSFGSLSGTIATNIDTSYGWIIPIDFYTQIPNAKSGTCTITCETYNNDVHIGTKTTTFTVTANENLCKPTLIGTVKDINQITINLTGDENKIIKYYSTAHVEYEVSAKNSSSISSVTINNISTSNGYYNFMNSVYDEFVIIVTDSRGYSNSLRLTPTIINYIPLTMNASFYRTAPTTGGISVIFSGNYFNESFGSQNNDLTLIWHYKLKTNNSWIRGGTLTNDNDFKIVNNTFHSGNRSNENPISLGNIFNYQNSYDLKIEYSDKLINKTIIQTIPKGKPIVNWDEDMFNVNGKLKINNEEISNLHIESETECATNIYVDNEQVYIKRVGIIIYNGNKSYDTGLDGLNTNILGYMANINNVENTISYSLPNLMLSSPTTLNSGTIPIKLEVKNGYWNICYTCNDSSISMEFLGYVTIFYTKS